MEIIRPIKKKITIDNGENLVKDFWVKQQSNNIKYADNLFLLHTNIREAVNLITRKSLYIQTNKELDYDFIECLNNLWTRGINIYILTNKLYSSYKDTIVGKALIRFSDNIKGDLILIDGNTTISRGFVSDDSEFNNEKKYFTLNSEQVKECFEMFVYKFWKKTDFECIDENTFISPLEIQEAPFDIFPKLNNKSIILDDYINGNIIERLDKLIKNSNRNITLITNNVDIRDVLLEKIADKDEKIEVDIITNIQRDLQEIAPLFYPVENYNIYATNDKVFPMIIFDDSIAIIFTGEIKNESLLNSFCIIKENKDILNSIISYKKSLIENDKTYYYNSECKLKNIQCKSIFTDITKVNLSESIINEVEEVQGEPEICESLIDLFNGISNREVTLESKYSKLINYSYDLNPKYRDKKLNKDKIYDTWRDIYNNIEKYSQDLVSEIDLVLSENSGLFSNVISLFNSNRVNARQTIKVLNNMIMQISNRNYSKVELEKFDDILRKAYDDYVKLNCDIEQMKDYKQQNEKWENNKKVIEDNFNKINSDILMKESEINDLKATLLNNTIVKLEEEIVEKEVEALEVKDNLLAQSSTIKLYFEEMEMINDFHKFIDTTKIKNKNMDKVIDKAKEVVNYIFKEENYFNDVYINRINNAKNPAALTTIIKNVVVKELKDSVEESLSELDKMGIETLDSLEQEIDKLKEMLSEEKKRNNSSEYNKKISILQKELSSLENQKGKLEVQLIQIGDTFEYKASGKENKMLKIKKLDIKIINEELPKTGTLYGNKNNRQLAIKYWDELNLGIEEAARLNAELVCEI